MNEHDRGDGRISRIAAVQPRDYLLAQTGWPRTALGGYLPGH